MKIIITGTSGLIGNDVWHVFEKHHEVFAIGRNQPSFVPDHLWKTVDLVDPDLTAKTVHQINPDLIIHMAAASRPDECELNPQFGYQSNTLATRNLALACQRFDAELLMASTDQVFDGKKSTPYTELDPVGPVNHYGRSKIWAEEFVKILLRRFYIVRTSLVFGKFRAGFVGEVAKSVQSQKQITAATDLVNSPTYSLDLAQALLTLTSSHRYGTYHISNEGACTRYELANTVAKILKKPVTNIRQGKALDLKLPAPRAGYTPLENFLWNLSGFPKLRTWQEAIQSFLERDFNHTFNQ